MFFPSQLQRWTSVHLRGVGWYLKCDPQHVLGLEKDKFNSLEVVGGEVLKGETLAGLDEKAYERVIA
jgi:hypothetical protein